MRQFTSLMLLAALSVPVACSVEEGQLVDTAGGTQAIGGSTSTGGTSAKTGGSATGGSANAGGTSAKTGGSATGGSAIAVGGTQSAGGASNAGGSKASGGTTTLGGATGTVGGASSVGGKTATGGTSSAAGAIATGGMTTGGTITYTGGVPTTGGTKSVGGSPATGGTISSGGVPSTGGVPATGGAIPTGGTSSTGGAANCTINFVVYSDGKANPSNNCQVCETAVSTTAWVQLSEGASCGAAGDAVCYNGTCQSGCWISSTYYVANAVNTANACQTCQPSVSTAAWTPGSEGAGCGITGSPTVCHNGTCQSGCWIGSTYYAFSVPNPKAPCQFCEPSVSTTTWTTDGLNCGCTGAFETVDSSLGLCVAKMATITAPSASQDYSIDVTEVTKGQYDLWLATNPALPASNDVNCGYVTSYAEQDTTYVYTGADAAHHPVVYVDWCDAYAYCKAVGKGLCGAIGGGSNPFASYGDATASQWYRACTSGGTYLYPYGNSYQATDCDGFDYWSDNSVTMQTETVGINSYCVTSATGYAGVYDLSGNVWEWEDSCNGTGQSASCHNRGGSFSNYLTGGAGLTCLFIGTSTRTFVSSSYGFRCCAG